MLFDDIHKKDFEQTKYISKKYNKQWKRFAGRNFVGDCSELFKRLCPSNYYEFYVKYTKDGERTENNRLELPYCGRSENEIKILSEKYKRACGDTSIPLEEFIKNIYCHIIIETFDGHMAEKECGDILNNLWYCYEKPNGDEDALLAIDFKVKKGDKLIFLLQIKPISFFRGNKNESLIEDRKYAFEKIRKCRKIFNVPTFYMVYKSNDDGTVKWLTENNKLCFKLDRLCDEQTGLVKEIPNEFI